MQTNAGAEAGRQGRALTASPIPERFNPAAGHPIWPVLLLGLAAVLAVYGVVVAPRHSSDFVQISYVVEINSDDPNLNDPFLGSDEDIFPRYRYNPWIWTAALISDVFAVDPAELWRDLAPPVFAVLSIAAVYVMLRACRFSPAVAATGCLAWLLYLIANYNGGADRQDGYFFFERIGQDKGITWLILAPLLLASIVTYVENLPARDGLLPRPKSVATVSVVSFAALGLLAAMMHPLGVVFAAAFAVAVTMRSAWQRWSWPDGRVLIGGLAGLIPALAWTAVLRFAAEQESFRLFGVGNPDSLGVFDVDPLDTEIDLEHVVEVGFFTSADPGYIGLLNFLALAWIIYSVCRRRTSPALELAVPLFLIGAVIFVPEMPRLAARLAGIEAVRRHTWIFIFPATLALTDLAGWLWTEARARELQAWAGLCVAAVVLVFALNAGTYFDAIAEKPLAEGSVEAIEVTDKIGKNAGEQARVFAGEELNKAIPAYAEHALVVANPFVDDRQRVRAARNLSELEDYAPAIEQMRSFGANVLMIGGDYPLYDVEPPEEMLRCFQNEAAIVFVLAGTGVSCPNDGTAMLGPTPALFGLYS
jgi:Family of unknown function (DUF6077)